MRIPGAITVAIMICLAAAGCSAHSAASQTEPQHAPDQGIVSNLPIDSAFASPPTKIAPHNPYTGPPADPFAGTPADHWANGAAAIVVPAARPIDGYTAAQVKFAYQTTRKLLIAGELNRQTLLGGRPIAFADLLTHDQRSWFLNGLNKTGLDKHGRQVNTRGTVLSFAPGSTQLIGDIIKVHGTMRARAGKISGGYTVLNVDIDYIFVYPVEPPHQPTRWMRIVDQRLGLVEFGHWVGAATSFEPSIDYMGFIAGAQCHTMDGYVHPDYPDAPSSEAQPTPSGAPVDPYAMGTSGKSGCQRTTGT